MQDGLSGWGSLRNSCLYGHGVWIEPSNTASPGEVRVFDLPSVPKEHSERETPSGHDP